MPNGSVPSKPLALALLVVAQFMIILDASIVNVALPSIQAALHFSPESLSWIINAYSLMFGGFLLLGGRLSDLIGRRRVFIAGMTLFGVASLLGGFANTELQMIVCRGAQGLGAAFVSPAALSMISVIFKEGKERNMAFGYWGAAGASGGAVGLILGGMLTQWLGWEWIYFINVPVALAAALLARRFLIESREPGHKSYDVPGAITVTAGLMLIVYALVNAEGAGWGSPQTLGLLAGGAALIALFVAIELRTSEPLIPFSIFRLPTLRAANVFALVHGCSVLALFYVLTLYMQQVLGYDALQTGLGILPLSLMVFVSANIASKCSTRFGFKAILIVSTAIMSVGLFWLTQISAGGSYWGSVFGPAVVIGAGLGGGFVSITIAAMAGTSRSNAGLGSGLLNAAQQIGRGLGVAILIPVYTSKANTELDNGASQAVALTSGLATGTLVLAGLCTVALLLAIFTFPRSSPRAQPEPA